MGEKTLKTFVVIDNSNLLHQGQKALPTLLNAPFLHEISDLCFDYDKLVECILDGRESGGKTVLVTSTPSPLSPVWRRLSSDGYTWLDFPRPGGRGGEKGNDVAVAVESILHVMSSTSVGTLALVCGDGDYTHLVKTVLQRGWAIEVHFWPNGECNLWNKCLQYAVTNMVSHAEVSKLLHGVIEKPTLKDRFTEIVYAYGTKGVHDMQLLFDFDACHEEIGNMSEEDILKIARQWKTFVWWYRLGVGTPTLRFLFVKEEQRRLAINHLSDTKPHWKIPFPDIIEKKRGRSASNSSIHSHDSHPSQNLRPVKQTRQ